MLLLPISKSDMGLYRRGDLLQQECIADERQTPDSLAISSRNVRICSAGAMKYIRVRARGAFVVGKIRATIFSLPSTLGA